MLRALLRIALVDRLRTSPVTVLGATFSLGRSRTMRPFLDPRFLALMAPRRWPVAGPVALALAMALLSQPLATGPAWAGPYAPAAGQAGSDAVSLGDPRITGWATGETNYVEGSPINQSYANPTACLGPAVASTSAHLTELGDGGQITLTFSTPIIANGLGPDFAVFSNSFSAGYLKLAYVEVSADGANWYLEPNYSLTPSPIATYGSNMDPTNISGLAGKYIEGYGVPFSLAAVGLTQATYVRLIDVVGDGTNLDSAGNPIYDPYPNSNGFNVSGVAILTVPEPATWLLLAMAGMGGGWLVRRRRSFNESVRSTAARPPSRQGPATVASADFSASCPPAACSGETAVTRIADVPPTR
jgi:hypothetical protein